MKNKYLRYQTAIMKLLLTLCLLFPAISLIAQTDTTKMSSTDSAVYSHPEIESQYPGGPHAWSLYLVKNLRYPEEAYSNGIQGTVIVQFIVDSTGAVHDVRAISGPKELQEESINLIKKSNKWIPAMYYGRKVTSWKKQPFTFRLEIK